MQVEKALRVENMLSRILWVNEIAWMMDLVRRKRSRVQHMLTETEFEVRLPKHQSQHQSWRLMEWLNIWSAKVDEQRWSEVLTLRRVHGELPLTSQMFNENFSGWVFAYSILFTAAASELENESIQWMAIHSVRGIRETFCKKKGRKSLLSSWLSDHNIEEIKDVHESCPGVELCGLTKWGEPISGSVLGERDESFRDEVAKTVSGKGWTEDRNLDARSFLGNLRKLFPLKIDAQSGENDSEPSVHLSTLAGRTFSIFPLSHPPPQVLLHDQSEKINLKIDTANQQKGIRSVEGKQRKLFFCASWKIFTSFKRFYIQDGPKQKKGSGRGEGKSSQSNWKRVKREICDYKSFHFTFARFRSLFAFR